MFAAMFSDFFDRLNGADDIGCVVNNDQFCIFFKFFREIVRINKPFIVHWYIVNFDALLFTFVIEGSQYRNYVRGWWLWHGRPFATSRL